MEIILHQLRFVVYPIIYRFLYIPGGAAFLPSTVCLPTDHTKVTFLPHLSTPTGLQLQTHWSWELHHHWCPTWLFHVISISHANDGLWILVQGCNTDTGTCFLPFILIVCCWYLGLDSCGPKKQGRIQSLNRTPEKPPLPLNFGHLL